MNQKAPLNPGIFALNFARYETYVTDCAESQRLAKIPFTIILKNTSFQSKHNIRYVHKSNFFRFNLLIDIWGKYLNFHLFALIYMIAVSLLVSGRLDNARKIHYINHD